LQGFADTTALLPYDPKRARRELDTAGWRDSDRDGIRDRRGAKLAFNLLTPQDDPLRLGAAQAIASDLRRLGIGVEVRALPIDKLLLRLNQRAFEAFIGQWFVTGALDFDPVWRSDAVEQLNFGGYSSPAADSLLTQMQHELMGADREAVLRAFQKRVYADQPYLFLFQNPHWLVLGTAVQGCRAETSSRRSGICRNGGWRRWVGRGILPPVGRGAAERAPWREAAVA
jgi:peptide/nickel transport system substrate-binding protein